MTLTQTATKLYNVPFFFSFKRVGFWGRLYLKSVSLAHTLSPDSFFLLVM